MTYAIILVPADGRNWSELPQVLMHGLEHDHARNLISRRRNIKMVSEKHPGFVPGVIAETKLHEFINQPLQLL